MSREARETWATRVETLKASGLSVADFAAKAKINPHSLSWWRWHLGSGRAKSTRGRRRSRPGRSAAMAPAISPLTFVEMRAAEATEGLEVVLRSGIRIKVHPGFDAATLAHVLDVLESRS
jgi:hypothetical protein